MLAGLVKPGIRKIPPGFCAIAGSPAETPSSTDTAAASLQRSRFIPVSLPLRDAGRCISQRLLVEPEVLVARAIVDAVDHDRQPFQVRLPAGGATREIDDRPGIVLHQLF